MTERLVIPAEPNALITIPNQSDRAQKITISFENGESVSAVLIIGAVMTVQMAGRTPTITIDDVDS
jgi:hypothetical protein